MVIDASVIVSQLVPHDVHHAASRLWLARHIDAGGMVVAPAVLLAEVAGAIARRTGQTRLARRAARGLLGMSALRVVPVDHALAQLAATVAARFRVRGVDAIYIAAAAGLGLPLVTWDVEQRERAAALVPVVIPEAR